MMSSLGIDIGKIFSPFLAGIEEPVLFMQQPAKRPLLCALAAMKQTYRAYLMR